MVLWLARQLCIMGGFMWLKISYSPDKLQNYNFGGQTVSVEVVGDTCVPVRDTDRSVRVSPIFPLVDSAPFDEDAYDLHFFEFSDPFRILGRINQFGSLELKNHVYFSCGACAILLFCTGNEVLRDFHKLGLPEPKAQEMWVVKNGHIDRAEWKQAESHPELLKVVSDYSVLPPGLRTIVDEFVVSIRLIGSKTDREDDDRIQMFHGLVKRVDKFIDELRYLHTLEGTPPERFWTSNAEILFNPVQRDLYIQQIVDRLVQINSALSYVSTQMHSGSVPILERRSLIRRNSLLGSGSALRTLDRIVRFIESAFRTVNFEHIIQNQLPLQPPLSGTEDLTFPDRRDWSAANFDRLNLGVSLEESTQKLAYFSSRNGFRESEFAITAALNALWNGLSLEWSLMTITHEMLHSHVRLLLTFLFFRIEGSEKENYKDFYKRFYEKVIEGKKFENYSLLDSIRELIFGYCLRTQITGSLTVRKHFEAEGDITAPSPQDYELFYELLGAEYRNINEILVHVLDLHYFYGGRVTKYIPLIWCSWSEVPNVRADLRQYVLRSLLTLASKSNASEYQRFKFAVGDFKDILAKNDAVVQRFPILREVQNILSDKALLDDEYLSAFKNSLILVDLAKEILFSGAVAAEFTKDDKVSLHQRDDEAETEFEYSLPLGFSDDHVDSPMAYLFDRMLRVLRGDLDPENHERDITTVLLGMNAR